MTVYRGSRKHVLDWTARPNFCSELRSLLSIPIAISSAAKWMPRGPLAPREARLERFGPEWLPGHPAWETLQVWWLQHRRGANTPNWDIAVGCEIEGKPGLVLVEAKANHPELSEAGKLLPPKASKASEENHGRIKSAIAEACAGWQRIDSGIRITRDSHYQLANRLAFTWKLATLGIPVVLVYLGFLGDEGIREDAGPPFLDDKDWQKAFRCYVEGVIPIALFDRRIDIEGTSIWLFARSRPILEQSPRLTDLRRLYGLTCGKGR